MHALNNCASLEWETQSTVELFRVPTMAVSGAHADAQVVVSELFNQVQVHMSQSPYELVSTHTGECVQPNSIVGVNGHGIGLELQVYVVRVFMVSSSHFFTLFLLPPSYLSLSLCLPLAETGCPVSAFGRDRILSVQSHQQGGRDGLCSR